VTQRYVYIDELLRMAADKVASAIAAILNGGAGRSGATDRQPVASESALEHAPALTHRFPLSRFDDTSGEHLAEALRESLGFGDNFS
jgi:hypothetical protein